MSTLEERLRALRLTQDLFVDLADEKRLGDLILFAARASLDRYPTEEGISAWLDGSIPSTTAQWGEGLRIARQILESLLIALPETDDLHQRLRFAERHFPEASWLPNAGQGSWEPIFLDPWRPFKRLTPPQP